MGGPFFADCSRTSLPGLLLLWVILRPIVFIFGCREFWLFREVVGLSVLDALAAYDIRAGRDSWGDDPVGLLAALLPLLLGEFVGLGICVVVLASPRWCTLSISTCG